MALAACSDDPAASSTVQPSSTAVTPTTTPATVPAGPAPLLRFGYEFEGMDVGAAFQLLPAMLVSEDGRVFTWRSGGGETVLPDVTVVDADDQAIEALLGLARDHGLLAEVEYPRPTGSSDLTDIYDGDTVVDITADGATYTHRAFNLLLGGTESDPQRRALADFLDDADDWLNGDTRRAGGAAAIHSRGVPGAGSTQRDSGDDRR